MTQPQVADTVPPGPFDLESERRRLGACLRSIRTGKATTALQVAYRSSMSPSRITRIEKGELLLSYEELSSYLDTLVATGLERRQALDIFQNLVPLVAQDLGLAGIHDELGATEFLARAEHQATSIKELAIAVVPGLLQTAEYAAAMWTYSPTQIDQAGLVAARLARQRVLFDREKTFTFLLTEAAITNAYLPPAGMAAQIQQILSLSTLPNVELGVIVQDGNVLPAIPSVQTILLDEKHIGIDTPLGGLASSRPKEVAHCLEVFEQLTACAVWDGAATSWISKMGDTVRNHSEGPGLDLTDRPVPG